jgi:hypothetical protein
MLTKFLDKMSEKIAGGISKTHKKITEIKNSPPKPPKINTKDFEEKVLNPRPPAPSPQKRSIADDFPKELKVKRIAELPKYLKDVSKTTITIEENEMEKVVKVIIDIGPNLSSVMKDIVYASNSPGSSIASAFGPFLQESAKNIVLVLKENSENPKPDPNIKPPQFNTVSEGYSPNHIPKNENTKEKET